MKKIVLSTAALAVAAMAVFSGYKAYASKQDVAALLLNENIEALADGEGTPAGTCYLIQSFNGKWRLKLFCNEDTDSSTIYPCPSSESWGFYSETSTDRCTK